MIYLPCPDGGRCGVPAQAIESFEVFMLGPPQESIDVYTDSGVDPDDGIYPKQGKPWVTTNSYPPENYTLSIEHVLLDQFPVNSVSYVLTVCED